MLTRVASDVSQPPEARETEGGFHAGRRWCTLPAFGASSYIPSIVLERGLFIRERNDGLYRVITYLCSKASCSTFVSCLQGLF